MKANDDPDHVDLQVSFARPVDQEALPVGKGGGLCIYSFFWILLKLLSKSFAFSLSPHSKLVLCSTVVALLTVQQNIQCEQEERERG